MAGYRINTGFWNMRKIYQAAPEIEIAGSAAISMVDNLISEDISHLIEEHGLANIDVDDWIPAQQMFDLFNDVVDHGGSTQAFVAMGMRIAEQSEFPPEMLQQLTLQAMMEGWNDHYQANHRGGHVPPTETVKLSETAYELHLKGEEHLYPYDVTYGMIYSFCKRLLPDGADFRVYYDEEYDPYEDWTNGVIIHVEW